MTMAALGVLALLLWLTILVWLTVAGAMRLMEDQDETA
jgi:hypothetical protein